MSAEPLPSHSERHEHDGVGAHGIPGRPTGFSCPDCGGVLGEEVDGPEVRLRCRVGHHMTIGALDDAKGAAVEDALWAAVRALEEKAALSRRLEQRARRQEDPTSADRHHRECCAAERRSAVVRDLLREAGTTTD